MLTDIMTFLTVAPAIIGLGLAFYIIMFVYLSVPNIIACTKLAQLLSKNEKYRRYRYTPMIAMIVPFAFYMTVDMFESVNLYDLWLGILVILTLTPVGVYFYVRKRLSVTRVHSKKLKKRP